MKCKHKYFTMKDGVRVCVQCGKPASEVKQEIEDKMRGPGENKANPIRPDVIPPNQFWCTKCLTLHRETSRIGKRHLKLSA